MFASDLKALQESYEGIYEEGDGISCEMLEEIVEELIEECVEFGYSLNEASTAVENAAILYIDEAKVTYGSDTESPEQRRERAKAKVGEKKAAARKAAVKTAVGRAKAKAMGAVAGAGIAASIAKDTARRAGRTAVHKVTYGAQKKKEEVKSGVKSLIGRGLRKAAGAVGKVAQKAAGAASRLGEGKEQLIDESGMVGTPGPSIPGAKPKPNKPQNSNRPNSFVSSPGSDTRRIGGYDLTRLSNSYEPEGEELDEVSDRLARAARNTRNRRYNASFGDGGMSANYMKQNAKKDMLNKTISSRAARTGSKIKPVEEKVEIDTWDVVLEYLITNGHADTNAEALYIMSQMNEEMVQSIIETRMDPRGRPASGPMNVYAKNRPNTDPAFQAALERVRAADAKKTPEQRKAELDAYKARQANK